MRDKIPSFSPAAGVNRPRHGPRHRRVPRAGLLLALVVCAPLFGLVVVIDWLNHRSAEELRIADACVDWSTEPPSLQASRDRDFIARCEDYFNRRTLPDLNEDDSRWKERRRESGSNAIESPRPAEEPF